jgi:hypothetical protein
MADDLGWGGTAADVKAAAEGDEEGLDVDIDSDDEKRGKGKKVGVWPEFWTWFLSCDGGKFLCAPGRRRAPNAQHNRPAGVTVYAQRGDVTHPCAQTSRADTCCLSYCAAAGWPVLVGPLGEEPVWQRPGALPVSPDLWGAAGS